MPLNNRTLPPRVPQSLLYMGVLTYDSELLRRLRAGDHLAAGGEKEAEIRGCSIWAIEVGPDH